jgi:hypothetical protein
MQHETVGERKVSSFPAGSSLAHSKPQHQKMSPDPEYARSRLRTKSQEFARAAMTTRAASHPMLDSAWRVHRLGEAARSYRLRFAVAAEPREEKASDKKLTAMTESRVNRKAA